MSRIREECPICYQQTAIIKYMVISPCCGGKACRDCYLTYLLNSPIYKCMYTADCNKTFTRKTIVQMFKQTDCNKLFRYAAERIVQMEDKYIVKYHDLQALQKMKMEVLLFIQKSNDRIAELIPPTGNEIYKLQDFLNNTTDEVIDDNIEKYKKYLNELKTVHQKYMEMNKAFTAKYGGDIATNYDEYTELQKRKYISIRCPVSDCDGYTDISWKCVQCDIVVCTRCGEVKKEDIEQGIEHRCNEDSVLSFNEVMKNSKCCPKCRAFIQKKSGCSQMWCTNCNTAFDWNTMKIISDGNYHNPHFKEYVEEMKKQGIEVDLASVSNMKGNHWHDISEFVVNDPMEDLCIFMTQYLAAARNMKTEYDEFTNEKSRLRYINKEIDRVKFTTICRTNLTKLEKSRDIRTIYLSMCTIINGLLDDYLNNKCTMWHTYSKALDAIEYSNEQLLDLERDKVYTNVPRIDTRGLRYKSRMSEISYTLRDGTISSDDNEEKYSTVILPVD